MQYLVRPRQSFVQNLINNVLNNNNRACKEHLRIDSASFIKVLNCLPNKRHGWESEIELALFLFWLACGLSYRVLGFALNVPKTTAFRICKKYLKIFEKLLPKLVCLPTMEQLELNGAKFAQRANSLAFDKTAGSLDGTHIKIKCPVEQHNAYINKKLDYSIQVQGKEI